MYEGFFCVKTKEPGRVYISFFLVRSCQDLLEHKSWLLYSAQYLCIIVLNSSFHSAQIRPKSHSYMVDIYLLLFLFFCCNLCSSQKSRARYFCKKKSLQFFFQTKSFVFGCGRVSA